MLFLIQQSNDDSGGVFVMCLCMTEAAIMNITSLNISHVIEGEAICSYKREEISDLNSSPIWFAYLIIVELLVRLGPIVVLITLNIFMIRDFNVSIRRRKKMRATRFVQRTSSKLFPKSSKFFTTSTATSSSVPK